METLPVHWDHLLVAVVAVALPLYSNLTWQATRRAIESRGEPARVAFYREEACWQLAVSLAIAIRWAAAGRKWSELGLGPLAGGPWALLALAVVVAVVAFLWRQYRAVHGGRADLSQVAEQLDQLGPLLPDTPIERSWYKAVSVGAGVAEELFWRGFMLWYLTPWLGLGWSAVVSAVAFTLLHLYQGWKQLPGVAVGSTVATVLRLATGTVWVPMLLHAAGDWFQGLTAAEARRQLTSTAAAEQVETPVTR